MLWTNNNEEEQRLQEKEEAFVPKWKKWGPYVSARSWGTVREDYSKEGDAWTYFPFEEAHKRAYRWGEDGIAGWCDRYQILVFSPAFWNGKDPILKERLFGLSSPEGNHGEDVKECYYYLDAIPSYSYMKMLYKYPHQAFPYQPLKEENKKRSSHQTEYELVDTGIFEGNRYFDLSMEYAKESPEDLCIKIEAFNRSQDPQDLHILPQIWFRNQWSWTDPKQKEPTITLGKETEQCLCLVADDSSMDSLPNLLFHYKLGKRYFYGPKGATPLFTKNETRPSEESEGFYKDEFHQRIIHGKSGDPSLEGTKACLHYFFEKVPAGRSICLYVRLSDQELTDPLKEIEKLFIKRKKEADLFYETVHPSSCSEEEKMIQRQALAGLIWNEQIYLYDVNVWLKGDDLKSPPSASRYKIRNAHWKHLNSMRIFSMPDKWEYPWFAAWDQAFHSVIWSLIDLKVAKEQLWLLLFDQFQHPSGQIPAYEWEFSDLNPPLQGWACLQIYHREKEKSGKGDRGFLERCFHKLLINFAWWVNKVDSSGNNLFEGGFLGLDNIAVLDRSQKLLEGHTLQQSDGTGWMGFFCLNLMKIALELSFENPTYESLATKFFEHYVYIAQAMAKKGDHSIELWDEKDGFFYDVLRNVDGSFSRIRLRSLVGIIPLFAVEYFQEEEFKKLPSFYRDFSWFLKNRASLVSQCIVEKEMEGKKYYVFTPLHHDQLDSILSYVWNPKEFRAPFGLRSLSKYHEKNPFEFEGKKVFYEPFESVVRIKGGNSNWRGPVWVQVSFLLIQSLHKLAFVLGKEKKVGAPGEDPVCLEEMVRFFSEAIIHLFTKNKEGNRPFLGKDFPYSKDPLWNEHILFYEYFNPETGKGLGASHQSGWTSLVANILDLIRREKL